MVTTTGIRAVLAPAAAIAATILVAGCSPGDVQLNGKIFDVVGLSDATKSKSKEPKLAERAPLVMPPATVGSLPEPGSGATESESALAGLADPDRNQKVSNDELKRRQAEYCKVNYEQALTRGDEVTADHASGPLGPCRPSALSAIKQLSSSDDDDAN